MFQIFQNCCKIALKRPNLKLNSLNKNLIEKNVFNRKYSTAIKVENADLDNKEPNIDLITKDDPELKHKLKVLMLEAEVMRQDGRAVPDASFIRDDHWSELLKLPSMSARRKYLTFLFKLQKKKENEQLRKEKKRIEREEYLNSPKPEDNSHIIYGLGHNNIFLRFYDTTINQFLNHKLIQAMQFGQKLIVDCGFEKNMVTRENINCAKQLMLLFSDNRNDDDPFDLHFCNANREGQLMKALHKHIATMYEPSFPLHFHDDSYTNVFEKEKLVYLTPHARDVMTNYDHDAIYIVGAIVDKINQEPLTFAKAKKEGIKMQKFPLDKYLSWGAGSGKSLTLNQVLSILLDVKRTNDWKYALRHVPKRKLFNVDQTGKASSVLRRLDPQTFSRPRQYQKNNNKNSRLIKTKTLFED
ncbi:mitochondrial ribonuclease P protein 1 homolog [Onthophagus taurus]|uniref:mitochondrial ribonuclease P protein 1 homolog n=1 Tax=Onthophagus taurus TaxID=166361 RepID=UPI000C20DD02|nr:mitochondrial ribonuclease P protein 1 homolog [Onthophagus taurus]